MNLNLETLKRIFVLSVLSSIIVRGFFLFYNIQNEELYFHGDQAEYIELGRLLYNNFVFDENFNTGRLPLYPVFISGVLNLFNNLHFVIFIQHLLGLFFILIAYRIGLIYSKEIAFISGIISSLNFNFIIHGNFFLTETLFGLFFFLFLLYALNGINNLRSKDVIIASLFLGLSALVRPVVIYLPFIVVIFIFLNNHKFIYKLRSAVLFFITFCLIIFPWLLHNYKTYNNFSYVTSLSENFSGWIIPHIEQYEKSIDLSQARMESTNAWNLEMEQLDKNILENPFELEKEGKKYFFNKLEKYKPSSIARAWFWGGMKNVFSPPFIDFSNWFKIKHSSFYETSGNTFLKQAFNFVFFNSNIYYSIFLILGILMIIAFRLIQLIGIINLFKRNKQASLFLILIIIYFLAVSGPVGYAKYRFPFEMVFVLFSAVGLSQIFSKIKNKGLVKN